MRRRFNAVWCAIGFMVVLALPLLSYFNGNHSSTFRNIMVLEGLMTVFVFTIFSSACIRLLINWSLEDEKSGMWASLLMIAGITILGFTVTSHITSTYPNFHLELFVVDFALAGCLGALKSSDITANLHRLYHNYLASNVGDISRRTIKYTAPPVSRTRIKVQGGRPSR